MKVLVTDGESRAALAITRSLGRAGHHVLVGERRPRSLAGSSRFCAGSIVYPDPSRDEPAFIDHLARVTRERNIDVVMPVTDITTMSIAAGRVRFGPHCAIPLADAAAVEEAADKAALMKTALRLGVPVPHTWFVDSVDEALECPDLVYPLVIKSHRSRVRTAGGWRATSVRYASNSADLRRDLMDRSPHEYPLLLQEKIQGPGVGVFMCYDRGEPIATFSHRRIREKPPTGGVSVLSESIAVNPEARAYSERLLGALRWHGVAMVEFKEDLHDGHPKLMEINGRFWGSLQLSVDAGVDFPVILLSTLGKRHDVGSAPAYRLGVRSRWLWGDLDCLILRLRAGNGSSPDGRGRVAAVLDFLKFLGKDLHYENPRLSDLRPWIYETVQRFRRTT